MSAQRITIGGFSLPLPGPPHRPVIVVIDERAATLHAHLGSGPFDLLEGILRQGRIQFTKSDLIALLGDEHPDHRRRGLRPQRRDGDPW
jgi:hypothetical protein